jgi:hypothetical protein
MPLPSMPTRLTNPPARPPKGRAEFRHARSAWFGFASAPDQRSRARRENRTLDNCLMRYASGRVSPARRKDAITVRVAPARS